MTYKLQEHGLLSEELLNAFNGYRNPHRDTFVVLNGFLECSIEALEDIYVFYDITPEFLFTLAQYAKESTKDSLLEVKEVDFRITFDFMHKPDPEGIVPEDCFKMYLDLESRPHKQKILCFTKFVAK